ncbi:hypothetical protein Scep_003886 [Stephania cephalantha]|uniref:Transmembrane protein n=1 Tax=Stephania cephalantha TaxID=152367 RepID=A0AAP0PUU2_9MAGN
MRETGRERERPGERARKRGSKVSCSFVLVVSFVVMSVVVGVRGGELGRTAMAVRPSSRKARE